MAVQNEIDARLLEPGTPPEIRAANLGEAVDTLGKYVVAWNEEACKVAVIREIMTEQLPPDYCGPNH